MDVTHQASLLGSIETEKPLGEPAAENQAEEVTTLEMGIPFSLRFISYLFGQYKL